MRLLLIVDPIESIEKVRCFTDVWAHYLPAALRELGVELVLAPWNERARPGDFEAVDVRGVEHVLAFGLRYFSVVSPGCLAVLRRRVPGVIAHLYDGPRSDPVWTLCVCGPANTRSHPIGWAADADLIVPRHEPGELRILVDHPNYGSGASRDWSVHVLRQVADFARSRFWNAAYERVRVRRIVDGGFVDVDSGDVGRVAAFHRRHIPFREACLEYGAAHVFLPTHAESVGLTVLETAVAGALPVVRRGFVPQDRLHTVRHVSYCGAIDWSIVLNGIDVAQSRAVAMRNSWQSVARRVAQFFANART